MGVRVFAHAAYDVRRSARLLAELNDHNRTQPFRLGSPGRRSGVSEYSLPASAVDADTLAGMLGMVSVRADDLGPMLTAVYEGHTPYAGDAIHESQSGEDAA